MHRLGHTARLQSLPRPWHQQVRTLRALQRRKIYPRRHPQEWTVPMRPEYPLYEISDLLLDLDAQDQTDVRPFNSERDGEPLTSEECKARDHEARKALVQPFEDRYNENDSNFMRNATIRFPPFPISDVDLLALALLGKDSSPSNLYSKDFASILHENGVPHSVRHDPTKSITYLLRRRELARPPPTEPTDLMLLRTTLQNCHSFSQLQRIVVEAMRVPETRPLVSRLTTKLAFMCQNVRPGATDRDALAFLNNVVINLTDNNLPVAPEFYKVCVERSMQCQAFGMASVYIQRTLDGGLNFSPNEVGEILKALLIWLELKPSRNRHSNALGDSSRYIEAFTLLTGYIPGNTHQHVSLSSLIPASSRWMTTGGPPSASNQNLKLLVSCLAYLGAFRTLWHEWHKTHRYAPAGFISERGVLSDHYLPSPTVKAFVEPAMRSFDQNSASLINLAESSTFTTASEDLFENFQLDAVAIVEFEKSRRALKTTSIGSHPIPRPRTLTQSMADAAQTQGNNGYTQLQQSVIAGIVIGGGVALVIIITAILWFFRRRSRSKWHHHHHHPHHRTRGVGIRPMTAWGCHHIITSNGGSNSHHIHDPSSWSPGTQGCSRNSLSRHEHEASSSCSPYSQTSPCCAAPPHTHHTLRRYHSHPRTRPRTYQQQQGTGAAVGDGLEVSHPGDDLYRQFQRQRQNNQPRRQDEQGSSGLAELEVASTTIGSPREGGTARSNGGNGMEVSPQSTTIGDRIAAAIPPSCRVPSWHMMDTNDNHLRQSLSKYEDSPRDSSWNNGAFETRHRSASVTNTCDTCLGSMQRNSQRAADTDTASMRGGEPDDRLLRPPRGGDEDRQGSEDRPVGTARMAMQGPRRRFSFERSPVSPSHVEVRQLAGANGENNGNGDNNNNNRTYPMAGFGPTELSAEAIATTTPEQEKEVRHDTYYHP
ncbi:hypothetical protein F5Y16DRAFT_395726 [Xylariaceae sp. FL0255]|nr:hypothetical protein F5Y16DRAFT_395726 [Xylariaceae sp. FL0255]